MTDNHNSHKVHYIHKISSAVQQRIAGIFILSAIIIIAILILLQIKSSHLLDDRIRYNAYLKNAQGVSTETLINVSGIEVGRVQSIDITPDNQIHVKFFVYDSFQRLLRMDSTGELNKLSVLGNAAIMIQAGSHELPILPPNSTIPIQEPTTFDDLMARLTPTITNLNEIIQNVSALVGAIQADKIKSMSEDLNALTHNLKSVSQQIAEGQGLLGKVVYDEQLARDFTQPVKEMTPIVRDTAVIIKELKLSMRQVDSILKQTEQRVKEISDVIQPAGELMNKSNSIASELEFTTRQVNQEIVKLPEMVNQMQRLLDSTNRTINAVERMWPVSSALPTPNRDTLIREQPLDD